MASLGFRELEKKKEKYTKEGRERKKYETNVVCSF